MTNKFTKKCSKLLLEQSIWTTGGHNLLGADLTHPSQVIRPSGARLQQQFREMQIKTQWDINSPGMKLLLTEKAKHDTSWTRIWRTQNSYNTLLVRMYSHSLWNTVGRFVLQTFLSRSPKWASYPMCRCTSKGNGISICKRCCTCVFHHWSQQPKFTLCLSTNKSRLWELMILCTII